MNCEKHGHCDGAPWTTDCGGELFRGVECVGEIKIYGDPADLGECDDKVCDAESERVAKQVVIAMNSHAALLEACRHTVEILLGGDSIEKVEPWCQKVVGQLCAAIALAESQP